MRAIVVLGLFLSGGAPALAQTAPHAGMDMPVPAGAPASEADQAYAAAMAKMMADMRATPTGDPDRDFVTMMLPHHQGAIDMAEIELRYGKDPGLRKLAKDVVTSQSNEIAFMRTWLAEHP